jgi:flagellar L-ring protein precursor FlgH
VAAIVAALATGAAAAGEKAPGALDRYIEEALARGDTPASTPGSLYVAGGRFGDLARDPRSVQVNDLVTVVVSDRASAVARGATNSSRKSSSKGAIQAVLGATRVPGPLSDLARAGSESQLQGQGETSRETTLNATLSARVAQVLPNGYLVIEGAKDIQMNSERQRITIRGVARPTDISAANTVRSDRLANLEVRVDGKGVVGDAIRRPNFLYRLLLGVIPF